MMFLKKKFTQKNKKVFKKNIFFFFEKYMKNNLNFSKIIYLLVIII